MSAASKRDQGLTEVQVEVAPYHMYILPMEHTNWELTHLIFRYSQGTSYFLRVEFSLQNLE